MLILTQGTKGMKLKIGIIGSGKLASCVIDALNTSYDAQLSGIYSQRTDINATQNITQLQEDSDILIDCSTNGFDARADKINKPLVIATTQEYEKLPNVPILVLPNGSIGWNCVHMMVEKLSKLGKYEFIITDIHHKHKKDAPSGTARRLIKALEGSNVKCSSHRVGEVFGLHQIIAIGEHETIKIEHEASSRAAFGTGLISAAKWLHGKPNSTYTANDWLKK